MHSVLVSLSAVRETMFGLGKNDYSKILGQCKGDWTAPNAADVGINSLHISELSKDANL